MAGQVVVYSAAADSEAAGSVAARLRANGIEIVEEQAHMLLVSGPKPAIRKALGDESGWSVTGLTEVPHPRTRVSVRKAPSD